MQIDLDKLAIDGGLPVRTAAYPPWPVFEPDDVEAASAVLRSGRVNYWTGEHGRQFEREFAAACGVEHAVAVASGTVALELALRSVGVGRGDEVIVPCRSFVSSLSSIVVGGATPVMVDIDRDSQTITADTIARALGPRTRAVVAVHLAGWPCDMEPILELASCHGLKVIEDCAQAQGARYRGRAVGSIGNAGAFSFCQDKIMTTGGEGGMLTTSDPATRERAWSYRDHGRSCETAYSVAGDAGYRWVYNSVGTNWRLTEMQAALGRRLLNRVDAGVRCRRKLALRLGEAFASISALRTPNPPAYVKHAYYRFYTFVRPERLREDWNRDRIRSAIRAEGIPCFAGSCPEVYREAAYAFWRPMQRCRIAEELGETSLAFPVHPTIGDADIEDTVRAVQRVMEHASA